MDLMPRVTYILKCRGKVRGGILHILLNNGMDLMPRVTYILKCTGKLWGGILHILLNNGMDLMPRGMHILKCRVKWEGGYYTYSWRVGWVLCLEFTAKGLSQV
jgi:hypothetical protein